MMDDNDEFEDDTAGDNANYEQLEWIVAKRGLTSRLLLLLK